MQAHPPNKSSHLKKEVVEYWQANPYTVLWAGSVLIIELVGSAIENSEAKAWLKLFGLVVAGIVAVLIVFNFLAAHAIENKIPLICVWILIVIGGFLFLLQFRLEKPIQALLRYGPSGAPVPRPEIPATTNRSVAKGPDNLTSLNETIIPLSMEKELSDKSVVTKKRGESETSKRAETEVRKHVEDEARTKAEANHNAKLLVGDADKPPYFYFINFRPIGESPGINQAEMALVNPSDKYSAYGVAATITFRRGLETFESQEIAPTAIVRTRSIAYQGQTFKDLRTGASMVIPIRIFCRAGNFYEQLAL